MRILLPLAFLALLAPPAKANDGFGGLSATGLTFGQTDAVAMEEEDLFISVDRVRVSYLFRNITDQDVTGEVIFPLPPISVGAMLMSDWNLSEDRDRADLVNFRAVVDGTEVPVTIDRIAVIEPPWEESRPTSAEYDTPGRNVTAELARFGIPLSPNPDTVFAKLKTMPRNLLLKMADAGLLEIYGDGPEYQPEDLMPAWSIVLRYHWTQTFPAGKALRIDHSYDNLPPGGIFVWQHPPQEDWLQDQRQRYCIDDATSRGIMRRLSADLRDGMVTGMSYNIRYVLRTANSWSGPISRFRLTLDKGSENHVISLCADGIRKAGPTTFVMEKRNFVPEEDLEILLVRGLSN